MFCPRNGQVMCISTFVPFSRRVKDLFSGIKQQGKDIVSFLKMTKEFKMQVCKWRIASLPAFTLKYVGRS